MANLRQNLNDSDTTIYISDTSNFPVDGGVIQIESEKIRYTRATDWSVLGCERAYDSTSADTHEEKKSVTLLSPSKALFVPQELVGMADPVANLTGVGYAGPAARYTNTTTGTLWFNSGDMDNPAWAQISSSVSSAAAGNNTEVQFNNNGVLGASANLTFDGTYLGAPAGLFLQENNVNGQAELDFANSTAEITMQIFNDTTSSESNPNMYFKGLTHSNNIFMVPKITNSFVVCDASTDIAAPTAKLQINSVTMGFLPPCMTSAQRSAISLPAEGLIVYDTDLHKLCLYNGSAWQAITAVTI